MYIHVLITCKDNPNTFLQQKYLQASDFLQNVVYINLQTTDEDKINRYCTLSQLYSQIGFKRKACFFKRIAAMQCVAPNIPQQNWLQCYKLLMQALEGYRITLDPKDIPEGYVNGWPILQSRVLNELIFSARKMGNLPVAVRKEIASTLDSLTARCEGTSQSLALENGVILPPVPLTRIPFVKSFKLVRLQPHLEPVKLGAKQQVVDSGPFIFTPLAIGQNSPSKSSTTVDFSWGLLTEGVEVEMYPTNLCIPAESVPNLVKILSRPKTSGTLNILGEIILKMLYSSPALFQRLLALRQQGTELIYECLVTLQNTSNQLVERVDVSIDCKPDDKVLNLSFFP
ncbi:hypothetical protein KUTeg_000093 [Tegillarca granosa]|uniref:Trafficking protein particle complex subunit 9 n=1 Tax=Tegillarca granosa TaxID=220873 RepID=A0ABQ9FWJ9_TEGGR|nr:hypothetical protein KUTeg_000093 [Tegillarca granosa]